MNKEALREWFKLTEQNKQNIFGEIAKKLKLPSAAIEKDWWVMRTLEMVFTTEIATHTVFKGGTSLSKAWNLIERFSEDIDLSLDRKFLGFKGEMTNSQVKKLREHSFKYISEKFFPLLNKTFTEAGYNEVELELIDVTANDNDPLKIAVNYPVVTEKSAYLQPRVIVEIGSRSLIEPFTEKLFSSMVGEHFGGRPFADKPVSIPTVNPERTFLEKIFLLHEEYQKPSGKMKIDRLSRHLYDLEKIMDTAFSAKALEDKDLYWHIVDHRKIFSRIPGVDYSNHTPDKINIIPPAEIIDAWAKDYDAMTSYMIYGEAKKFEVLIKRIQVLQDRVRNIKPN